MSDGIVNFNYQNWALRYPELAVDVPGNLAQLYFTEAALYCDNTANSPITAWAVGGQRELLLNMATAHIAALNAKLNGNPASPLVGRLSSATQGSVSVQTQNDFPPGSAQWWQQTRYGAAFWAATGRYKTFRYVRSCNRNLDPYLPWKRW